MLGLFLSLIPVTGPAAAQAFAQPSHIYAVLLADSRCTGAGRTGARGRDLVVQRELVVPTREWWWNAFPHTNFPQQIPTWLPRLRPDTLEAFLKLRDATVDAPVTSRSTVTLIDDADVERMSKGWFWTNFYQRYPSATGTIRLSGVGWSTDRREALVYCGSASESMAGAGFLVLLRYDGERWTTVQWQQVWQS